MVEKEVESYLTKSVERSGGMCIKFTSVNLRGVPDRIVIHPRCGVVFVELKRPGGQVRLQQKYRIDQMIKVGAQVEVLDTRDRVDDFLRRYRIGI